MLGEGDGNMTIDYEKIFTKGWKSCKFSTKWVNSEKKFFHVRLLDFISFWKRD